MNSNITDIHSLPSPLNSTQIPNNSMISTPSVSPNSPIQQTLPEINSLQSPNIKKTSPLPKLPQITQIKSSISPTTHLQSLSPNVLFFIYNDLL